MSRIGTYNISFLYKLYKKTSIHNMTKQNINKNTNAYTYIYIYV